MFKRQKFLTAAELQAEVDAWADDEDNCDGKADQIDIVVIPPDVDEISDLEDLDDDVQLMSEDNPKIQEVAGVFEVEYTFNNACNICEDENKSLEVEKSPPSKMPRTEIETPPELPSNLHQIHFKNAKWSTDKTYKFPKQPFDNTEVVHKELFEKIGELFDVLFISGFHIYLCYRYA